MSQQTNSKEVKNNIDNLGFKSALYIDVDQYENIDGKLKEATDGLELLRLRSGSEISNMTPNMTPRQSDTIKNYISSDLMMRLEESSPIKSLRSSEYMRRLSDFYNANVDEENSNQSKRMSSVVNLNRCEEEGSNQRESAEFDQNENVISNLSNFTARNFKLKTHMMQGTQNNDERVITPNTKETFEYPVNRKNLTQMKEEPQSLFTNSMNFSNNNNSNNPQQPTSHFSPIYNTKQAKQTRGGDSSPIYTYYDGTAECLSQTFYDEFKKSSNEQFMSKNNFIKKAEPSNYGDDSIQNQSAILSGHSKINSKLSEDNSINPNQMPFNMFANSGVNLNHNFNNFNKYSHQNFPQNNYQQQFSDESRNLSHDNSVNFIDYSDINNSEYMHFKNKMNNFNFNPNQPLNRETPIKNFNYNMMNPNALQFNNSNNQMNPGHLTNVNLNQGNVSNFGNVNNVSNLNNSNISNDQDEYTVEMFGRKGWICEMCNNFNYETRQKCNRCGINKSPKKVKNKQTVRPNAELNNDLDESMEKKKKPFTERVGDWVCIKCKNLNFSFRVVCNRCQLPKSESDKMFDTYMGNLMNYVKINEMMQQKIIQNPHPFVPSGNGTNFVNNKSVNNNNNNYFGNFPQNQMQNQNKAPNQNFVQGRPGMPFNNNGPSFFNSSMSMGGYGNVGNISSMSGVPFQMSNNNEEDDFYNEEN